MAMPSLPNSSSPIRRNDYPLLAQAQTGKATEAKKDEEVIPGANLLKPIPIDIKCLYNTDGNLTLYGEGLKRQLEFKAIDKNTVLFYSKHNDNVPLHQQMYKPFEPYRIDKNKIKEIKFKSLGEYSRESFFEIIFLGKDSGVLKKITIKLGNDTRL